MYVRLATSTTHLPGHEYPEMGAGAEKSAKPVGIVPGTSQNRGQTD